MTDRQPQYPGRVLITPEDSSTPYYATLALADEPLVDGTPLNKANLLSDSAASAVATATGTTPETPSEAAEALAEWAGNSPSMLVDLTSNSADDVFKAAPRPGVTGVLPQANLPIGGFGADKRGTFYLKNGFSVGSDGGLATYLQVYDVSSTSFWSVTAFRFDRLLLLWVGVWHGDVTLNIENSGATILDNGLWGDGFNMANYGNSVIPLSLTRTTASITLSSTVSSEHYQVAPIVIRITPKS